MIRFYLIIFIAGVTVSSLYSMNQYGGFGSGSSNSTATSSNDPVPTYSKPAPPKGFTDPMADQPGGQPNDAFDPLSIQTGNSGSSLDPLSGTWNVVDPNNPGGATQPNADPFGFADEDINPVNTTD